MVRSYSHDNVHDLSPIISLGSISGADLLWSAGGGTHPT